MAGDLGETGGREKKGEGGGGREVYAGTGVGFGEVSGPAMEGGVSGT